MLVYLSKKIAIPNNIKINCISWNATHDWIAVGGDNGLLKVIKLENGKGKTRSPISGNVSLNQTLQGHTGQVQVVAWNQQYEKLTSCDSNGLIIVWTLHKGSWYEEMINNRNKSVVRGVAWNSDGQKICIVYEDGGVVVGDVDGNRIWGKEMKKTSLTHVQWSPDSRYLLFGMRNSEVHLYNDQGEFLNKLKIQCLPSTQIAIQIASLKWHYGKNSSYPQLAIVYQPGHIQLMKHYYDDNPIVLNTNMRIFDCRWNHDGNLLAIVGSTVLTGDTKDSNIVQFFNAYGEHIRSLKLPGNEVSACDWEGNSLRLALCIDFSVYFANVHPDYQWCYSSGTVIFPYMHKDSRETMVTFWNYKKNECYKKILRCLISVSACGDHCVLGTVSQSDTSPYTLLVCNTVATVIDHKDIDLEPLWITMNNSHVFAASQHNFLMWSYLSPKSQSSMLQVTGYKKERTYHIDDTPSGIAEMVQDVRKDFQVTEDEICSIACSNKVLLVGRKSGVINQYTLPQIALIRRFDLKSTPHIIAVNCNSSKVSVISSTGNLSIVTIDAAEKNSEPLTSYKAAGTEKNEGTNENIWRRDVWSMKWASDDPTSLAIMEKTKMNILHDGVIEESINSEAYIAHFQDLEVQTVSLDEILRFPDKLIPDYVIKHEVKYLRAWNEALQKGGIREALTFTENNPLSLLWRLSAEVAAKHMDVATAETCFVRCSDYSGIQLVKQLGNIQNEILKKAHIEKYFENYDEAEKLYLKADRRDIAISLRERLGDWFRAIDLMKLGSVTSDSLLNKCYSHVGDYFMDRHNPESANEYYQKCGDVEKLIECYRSMEDYEGLETCISLLPEGHELLKVIAEMFSNAGLCIQAVASYVKLGAYQAALNTCLKLKMWEEAIDISRRFQLESVQQSLEDDAQSLLESGKTFEAIQVYRKGRKYSRAVELLYKVITQEGDEHRRNPLTLKKLSVLGALLSDTNASGHYSKTDSRDTLKDQKFHNLWHCAEAYHYLLLSRRLLIKGDYGNAFNAAIELKIYEDVLPSEQIHCLIAVTALACKAYATASKAFIELTALNTSFKNDYEDIGASVFYKNIPIDPPEMSRKCGNCKTDLLSWNSICPNCQIRQIICSASGQAVLNAANCWQCTTCKRFFKSTLIGSLNNCSLCHSSISQR